MSKNNIEKVFIMPNTNYACIEGRVSLRGQGIREIVNIEEDLIPIKEGDVFEAEIMNDTECKLLRRL